MTDALIGLFGVIIGLAIGRGYGFWAGRRQELAGAAIATAVLAEELQREGLESAALRKTWREHRRWLVIHLSPRDYRLLGQAIRELDAGERSVLTDYNLVARVDALNELFWEEHEAFILVPLIHYLRGNTVSKRIRDILEPTIDIRTLPERGGRSAIRSWHSPSDHPSRIEDSQPAAPE